MRVKSHCGIIESREQKLLVLHIAKDSPTYSRGERYIAGKIPHGSIAAIFRLSVATVAGNVHAVGRYRNAPV